MTLTVAEIIEEVRREAERKHGVPDEMAQNWPRFPLVKVVPLCDEVDRLTGDNAALSEALDTALLHLKESEAERDALAGQLAKVQAIITRIDQVAPLADETCDEPGITLSEAIRREIEWQQA
jgi:hypothetical protein